MSDLSVTERRLRPIQDAVNSRNWKQALQQCDKWQKKGEKSDRFLALKASILVNQPDKSQFEKGKTETLQLCNRTPAVTDIEALYQLQDSLKHLSLHREEGPKLWERAIAARPNDKDLLTTLLNGSISDGNWMSAQKAAMALRKAFPKERQYDFWNMLLCYLIHQDTSFLQKDRDLFGRLAYMLMSKAVEAVPASKDQLLAAGKAVSTPEELALLVKIYIATGHADQSVKLLQSDGLGLQSRVAEPDPPFAFSLFLQSLNASEDQDEAFGICRDLILSGSSISKQHLEDDRVWKILQDATKNSKTAAASHKACLELAQSVYQSQPSCRAAYLAFFNLAAEEECPADEVGHTALGSACISYYYIFHEKPFCFGDLVHPLLSNEPALRSFKSKVEPDGGSPVQRAFALKLRHACLGTVQHPETEAEYLKLTSDAIQLHKQLPKEKSECPEMILLAATILLRLALKTQNSNYSIQASYLLHHCYSKFNEYYPIAIRQVQLYLTQGQISLAMERFASLVVKNVQWETVGHLLLTRISTLHPWQAGSFTESLNPLAYLDAGLVMLENADQSLDKAIHGGLKFGSYANIIDSVNVKDNMAKSMNRQTFLVEERRIQRVVGIPQDFALDPYPANMVDQRDFEFIPYFGNFHGRNELEKSLSCGPLPKNLWLMAMALHDHLITHLKAELGSSTTLSALAFDRLKTILEKTKQQEGHWTSQLTEDELSSLSCHQTLSQALLLAKDYPTSKQEGFHALVNDLKSWLDTMIASLPAIAPVTVTINSIETPTWKFLHRSLTNLETLQTISLFLSLQARRTKTSKPGNVITIPKDKLAEFQQLVLDAEKSIHDQTKRLKDRISASGVLGQLVDAASGRIEDGDFAKTDEYKGLADAVAELVDEAALEEYCGALKASWEDGLDGVLRVKVRVVK